MRKLRQVIPRRTYLVTKKCVLDEFIIVPSEEVDAILLYCLFASAARYGIVIHGFCFQANHFHLLVTDGEGLLPAFMGHYLTNSAKSLNKLLGRTGSVWSATRYSAVALLDLDAAERKTAYALLNPVDAELVQRPEDYPGVSSAKWSFGERIQCERPAVLDSKNTSWPAVTSCVLTPLGEMYGEDNTQSTARIQALVRDGVERASARLRSEGRRVLGTARILSTPRNRRSTHSVGALNPRFATRDPELMRAALESEAVFHEAHDRAKKQFLDGDRSVIFPFGTYGYRCVLGVQVAETAA